VALLDKDELVSLVDTLIGGRDACVAEIDRLRALIAHLPREHVTIEPEDTSCPICRIPMHKIGEDVAEQLDFIPAQFKGRGIHRPRYGCRCGECAPVDGGGRNFSFYGLDRVGNLLRLHT